MGIKPVILIVAPPGNFQIGLQALLTNRLEADVLVTGEGPSALKVIERHNPAMVILDHDIRRNSAPIIFQRIKSSWPDIRCIVLVNDAEAQSVELGDAEAVRVEVGMEMGHGPFNRKIVGPLTQPLSGADQETTYNMSVSINLSIGD